MSPLSAEPFSARGPLLAWAALLLALLTSAVYAFWPAGPLKLPVGLTISLVKAVLIGLVFMRLNKASPLLRLAALAGSFWLLLLFCLAFADYLTRPGG